MEEKAYTVKELMELLQVSEKIMLRELNSGRMPAIKIGRQWRVSESNYRKYINGQIKPTDIPVD